MVPGRVGGALALEDVVQVRACEGLWVWVCVCVRKGLWVWVGGCACVRMQAVRMHASAAAVWPQVACGCDLTVALTRAGSVFQMGGTGAAADGGKAPPWEGCSTPVRVRGAGCAGPAGAHVRAAQPRLRGRALLVPCVHAMHALGHRRPRARTPSAPGSTRATTTHARAHLMVAGRAHQQRSSSNGCAPLAAASCHLADAAHAVPARRWTARCTACSWSRWARALYALNAIHTLRAVLF